MKIDISRPTFDRTNHYSQVVMQQGRVQLDADWNEQQDIHQYRIETQTRDTIGQSGVPQHGGGFKVTFTPDGRDLLISSGRIYVDGVLCELDEVTPVAIQGFHETDGVKVENLQVDGRAWKKGQWVELLDEDRERKGYLQIKAVSTEEKTNLLILTFYTGAANPGIAALQNADIDAVRRVITYTTQPDYPNPAFTDAPSGLPELAFTGKHALLLVYLDVWQRHITALDDTRIREVALGGPDTSTRRQVVGQVKIMPIKPPLEQQESLEEEEIVRDLSFYDCDYIPDDREDLLESPTGKLNVTTYDANSQTSSGYQGLQNELYHVEIHEMIDDRHPLTFKWARNNASTATLANVKGDTVIVPGTGQGGILNFNRGEFVEVVSDQTELSGQPGKLAQITRVDTLTNQLTLNSSLGSDGEQIKIRLWDGKGEISELDTWLPLDAGIRLQFSRGTYNRGDYWLIPARTSTKEVEWPPYENPNIHPIPQLRHGVEHRYIRLAHIRWYRRKPISGVYAIAADASPSCQMS